MTWCSVILFARENVSRQNKKWQKFKIHIIKNSSNHLSVSGLSHFLTSRKNSRLIGVHKISHRTTKSRLKNNARKCQHCQFWAVPCRHAAHENIRVCRKFAKLKFLATWHFTLRHAVNRQCCMLIITKHLIDGWW